MTISLISAITCVSFAYCKYVYMYWSTDLLTSFVPVHGHRPLMTCHEHNWRSQEQLTDVKMYYVYMYILVCVYMYRCTYSHKSPARQHTRSLAQSSTRSLACPHAHSHARPPARSLACPPARTLTRTHAHSLARSRHDRTHTRLLDVHLFYH